MILELMRRYKRIIIDGLIYVILMTGVAVAASYLGSYPKDLNINTPQATDPISEGDDAIREIKKILSYGYVVRIVTEDYTVTASDSYVICNSTGDITITLPSVSLVSSDTITKPIRVMNIGNGVCSVSSTSPINGSGSDLPITTHNIWYGFVSNTSGWYADTIPYNINTPYAIAVYNSAGRLYGTIDNAIRATDASYANTADFASTASYANITDFASTASYANTADFASTSNIANYAYILGDTEEGYLDFSLDDYACCVRDEGGIQNDSQYCSVKGLLVISYAANANVRIRNIAHGSNDSGTSQHLYFISGSDVSTSLDNVYFLDTLPLFGLMSQSSDEPHSYLTVDMYISCISGTKILTGLYKATHVKPYDSSIKTVNGSFFYNGSGTSLAPKIEISDADIVNSIWYKKKWGPTWQP